MELPKDQSDQSVQPANTGSALNVASAPVPPKSGKKLYLIFAIFLIAALIGGGAFYFLKSSDGGDGSESIPSLKKASGGLQGKIEEQEPFLKIKPKSFDDAKKEIENSTDEDKKAKGIEFLTNRAKDPKYKSDMIAEFTFNADNKGLYLFFPNQDMSFKEIRDSIVSVDNKEEIQVMFAQWNPELDSGKGQWMATEQNYYDEANIKELESDTDLANAVVKKGQGVVIMAPANIIIPNGHDSTFSAGTGSFDLQNIKKGWILLSAYGDTLGETFKDDCLNRVSTVFVQDNAKTANMADAFVKVELADKEKFKSTGPDKGFYAVWVYVNDEVCVGVKQPEENGGTGTGELEVKVDLNPTNVSLVYNETGKYVELKFDMNSNAKGYNIYYHAEGDTSPYASIKVDSDCIDIDEVVCAVIIPGDKRIYHIFNFPDGTYKFKIAGIDEENVQAELKDVVETGEAVVGAAAAAVDLNPTNVSLVYLQATNVLELVFTINSDSVGYNIYYRNVGDSNSEYAAILIDPADPVDKTGLYGATVVPSPLFVNRYDFYNFTDGTYKFKIAGIDSAGVPATLKDAFETGEAVVGAAAAAVDLNPTNVQIGVSAYPDYVILTWDKNDDAVNYKVYSDNGTDGDFSEVSTIVSTETSYASEPSDDEITESIYGGSDLSIGLNETFYAKIYNLDPGNYKFGVFGVGSDGLIPNYISAETVITGQLGASARE